MSSQHTTHTGKHNFLLDPTKTRKIVKKHITIDLVAAEGSTILSLYLCSALATQLGILSSTVFQVLSLLVSQLANKTDGVASPELHMTPNHDPHFSRRNGLPLLHNGTSAHE